MPARIRTRRSGRGSAMVEGALVITLMVITLIGIVDVGQVMMFHQALNERVRAAARYAVVNSYSNTSIKNIVLYGLPNPGAGAKPLLLLKDSMVTTELVEPESLQARIVVRITNYPFNFFTPLLSGSYSARPIVITMPAESMGATL